MNKDCEYCPHPLHEGKKCSQCKCKGKPGFWRKLANDLGNALGEAFTSR
jgi:hypothetical protein